IRVCLPSGVNQNNVIARLPFDFWVHLLKSNYAATIWSTRLREIFPQIPNGIPVANVYEDLESLRNLRNSVAHYEPVFDLDLANKYTTLCKLVSWLCPLTYTLMEQQSSHSFRRILRDYPEITAGRKAAG